ISEPDEQKVFQILEVRLLNSDGKQSTRFDISSPVLLHIKYVIRKPVSGTGLSIEIFRGGIALNTSFDTDQMEELLVERQPGTYNVQLLIPPMVLKPGVHSISVGSGILNQKRLDFIENAVAFDVVADSESDSLKGFAAKRAGVVILPLQWSFLPSEAFVSER